MKRRNFLLGMAGLGAGASGILAAKYWPENGFWNPCYAGLPDHLNEHSLVKTAWQGIDPVKVWDSHAHLTGLGDSGSGVWVNEQMDSLMHPGQYLQKKFFLNAGCADPSIGIVDEQYVKRMQSLLDQMPKGPKLILLAFDYHYNEAGEPIKQYSTFYVPNEYVMKVAKQYPAYFEWTASIHPYRKDCVEVLKDCVRNGARAVKWLPAAMGMNPGSPLCDRFYEALAQLDVPLIVHAGKERAVHGGDTQHYGNPLLLRRALDQGVRVIVAHCASMGQDQDYDKGKEGPVVESFDLFSRLMDDHRYEKKLFADISAMTQVNRIDPALGKTIERTEWHNRLLNGSDYPLPGVMPLFSVRYLADLGYVDQESVSVLNEIRKYNPLLFDFVLKRSLRYKNKCFALSVFETRSFFERKKP